MLFTIHSFHGVLFELSMVTNDRIGFDVPSVKRMYGK